MANIKKGLLIEYSDLFDDEPEPIEFLLEGLNQTYLKRSLIHLLGPFMEKDHYDFESVLRTFFSPTNADFAKTIFIKLLKISHGKKILINIINPYSVLSIFEKIYNNKSDISEFGYDAEIKIFKSILLVNKIQNSNQKKSYPLIKQGSFPQSAFTLSFPYSEINNGNQSKILITQIVKMSRLLDFLSKHKKGNQLLNKYLFEFGFSDIEGYVRILVSFISTSINAIYTSRACEFKVGQNEDYLTMCNFIDKVTLIGKKTIFEEDFTTLKRKPLLKIADGHYQIIYLPFVMEMIFKGMYFQLNEINNNYLDDDKPLIKNFRGIYCHEFSEKKLLYSILLEIYQRRYKCFTGEEIKISGIEAGPDFYMRNGNYVFLFESKDVMIDKKIKVSHDYSKYEIKLREKFYNNENGDIGIYQIIKNVRKILDGEYHFDNRLIPHKLKIYPILVVHDRCLDVEGLNVILKNWFEDELNKLKELGYSISKVQNLILIDIDTLIYFKRELQNTSTKLDELLDNYSRSTKYNQEKINKQTWDIDRLFSSFNPFSNFVNGIFPKKNRNEEELIIELKRYL